MNDDVLTAVSLFAGIGGFDKALEDNDVVVTAAVEIDAACRGQLAEHFPETHLFEDVTKVTADDILATGFVPRRGILCGGWPCQGMSVAGRRFGLGDARSGLFWHVVRLANDLQPQWLLLENVPGLLSAVCPCPGDGACTDNRRVVRCGQYQRVGDGSPANPRRKVFVPFVPHGVPGGACPGGCMGLHGGAMGTVVGALGQLGYGYAYRVLDAQYFAVPQRRERVFFVGCLGDGAAPVQILFEPESGHGDLAESGAAGPDVAGTLGSRFGGARTTDLDGHGAYVAGTLAGTGPGGGWRVGADEAAAGQLVVPIQDGHFADRDQNGLGVGEAGAPAYTVDSQGYQAVVMLQEDPAERIVTGALTAGMGTNHGQPGYGGKDQTVLAVTAATLQGGGRRGHRIDAEGAAGGHLIVSQNGSDIQTGDQLGALTAGMERQTSGDLVAYALGSHSGTADGEQTNASHAAGGPVGMGISEETAYSLRASRTQSVVAFDGAQITHPENRANPQPGDPAPPLAATGQAMVAGFASALTGPLVESLNAGALPFALRTPGGASSYPVVAATLTAGTSDAAAGVSALGRRQEDDVNLVPVAVPVAWRGRGMEAGEPGVANAIRSGGAGHTGDQMGYVMTGPPAPADGGTAVAYALSARSTRQQQEQTWVTHALTSEGADASEDGTGRGTPLVSSMAFNWQAGGSKAMLGIGDKPTALTTNQTPAVTTAIAVRRLTPLECERLQGFPDNWTAGQSDSARYRQCGNAVAVPVVRWIVRRIVAVDSGQMPLRRAA